ncbi:MAG: Gx transporter family protein [Clostridiales Family XIII bacterium]|jgi:heptaprenyl diphosphate synthase|nr:Gx transporter family protein [Clostridiales Family XIII bacterium]
MRNTRTKKISFFALSIALAMIFSYVETLIPFPFFAPGMKLGLANIVTMIVLYKMKAFDAAVISLARILLSALLFGNVFSLAYSLSGGIFSLAVMILLKKTDRFSITGISIAGGVCHNIAQVAVAALLLETGELAYYLPILFVTGTVTGCLIGILGGLILKKLTRFDYFN